MIQRHVRHSLAAKPVHRMHQRRVPEYDSVTIVGYDLGSGIQNRKEVRNPTGEFYYISYYGGEWG